MNDNEQDTYTVALSPWINEYRTPGPIVTEKPAPKAPTTESNSAAIYRKCHAEVLKRLEQSQDRLGRSLKWKADAIREDLAAGRNNSYTDEFAKEVVALAEKYL